MKLILASASPRRAQVLREAGIRFEAMATETDEARRQNEDAVAMTLRLAEVKARAALSRLSDAREPRIVIGADTVVELDGEIFGKPDSADAAREMLRRLSGRTHRVLTGLAVLSMSDGAARFEVAITEVRFAALALEEIEEYVATDEPLDKAGAYAIQGIGGRFVERIDGCYFNVVGLPLALLYRMLKDFGWLPESE